VISRPGGLGKPEGSGFDRFEGQVDACHFVFGPSQGTEDQKLVAGFRENHPFAPSGTHKGSDGKGHEFLPKILGLRAMMSSQSAA
jgi:hypothetical protein